VVLEEKRREIIKEWIDSGRIEACQKTVCLFLILKKKAKEKFIKKQNQ